MANSHPARPMSPSLSRPRGAFMARARAGLRALWGEPALVLGLLLIGLLAQGLNMFNYPASTLVDDQGIYASQAWAVLREGRLSPYTYIYDHAPGGWILIAGWMWLTGGPGAYGDAIDSGRMLMLLLHLAMVPLLYHLARKLGAGMPLAALCAFLFSVSPLAVFYQRLLLLDTIMLFWVLLSLDLLLNGWGRLSRIVLSGACFGLALLSKEAAFFLLPGMLFIAVEDRRRHQGRFAVVSWVLPMVMVASAYPLYALLKGELFPSGTTASFSGSGYAGSNVSLLDALIWQVTRGGGGPFNLNNAFWELLRTDWLRRDAFLLVGGALAVFMNLVRGVRDRRALAAGLLGALPLLYLARGGVVFNYYILFAIPFLCLNLAVLLAPVFARIPARASGVLGVALAVMVISGYWYSGAFQPLYQERPDQAGREALTWIKEQVPSESLIIAPDSLWTDLRESSRGPAFPNVHSHWKVAADPDIRTGVFNDDWRTVDYLIMTPGLEDSFISSNNTVAREAKQNAQLLKRWEAAPGDGRLHQRQVIELWKVNKPGQLELTRLADSAGYTSRRFERDGAFVSPDGTVTSESQSYAMLRAVWSDDRAGFDRAWQWTRTHLIDRDGLPAWLWRDGAVTDPNTASDADVDIALALLFAGQRWDDPALLDAGKRMLPAIWRRDVAVVRGVPYLTAGDWGEPSSTIALNPSYFSPHAYPIFQAVDPDHNWTGLVDSSYQVLFAASSATFGRERSAGLPPDWVGLDRTTGALTPLPFDRADTTRYGYDAARTYWRVALHLRWNDDGRARAYLTTAGFLQNEVDREGRVRAVYQRDGTPTTTDSSLVGTAGALAALLTLNPATANVLYTGQLAAAAQPANPGVYWGHPDDLYAQAWGWFATAMYADALPNLWIRR